METMPVIIDGKEQERRIDYYEDHPTRPGFFEPVPYLYRGETYHRTVRGTVYIIKTE